jgi:hypothetical protein
LCQEKSESRELIGKVGTRSALLILHTAQRADGEFVALSADNCAAHCAAEAHIEPLLIDRRGNCELLRHGAR